MCRFRKAKKNVNRTVNKVIYVSCIFMLGFAVSEGANNFICKAVYEISLPAWFCDNLNLNHI